MSKKSTAQYCWFSRAVEMFRQLVNELIELRSAYCETQTGFLAMILKDECCDVVFSRVVFEKFTNNGR